VSPGLPSPPEGWRDRLILIEIVAIERRIASALAPDGEPATARYRIANRKKRLRANTMRMARLTSLQTRIMRSTGKAAPKPPSWAEIKKFREDQDVKKFREGIKSRTLLQITDPREVRHARILHWLFNPLNEHELGDGVIRALLRAAAKKASGDQVRAADLTRLANHTWKEAVVIREYPIRNLRCDLVIANPKQQTIVAIEFKAGAKLSKKQLSNYERGLRCEFPRSEAWTFVGVMLDSERRNHVEAEGDGWIPLDLGWLDSFLGEKKPDGRRGGSGRQAHRDYLEYLRRNDREHDLCEKLITRIAVKHSAVLRWMGRLSSMGWSNCIHTMATAGRREIDACYLSDWEHWQEIIDHLPFAPIYEAAHGLNLSVEVRGNTAYLYHEIWDRQKKSRDGSLWPVYIVVEQVKDDARFKVKTIGRLEIMSSEAIKRLESKGLSLTRSGRPKKWTTLEKPKAIVGNEIKGKLKELIKSTDAKLR